LFGEAVGEVLATYTRRRYPDADTRWRGERATRAAYTAWTRPNALGDAGGRIRGQKRSERAWEVM